MGTEADIKSVAVVGGGAMGAGIIQTLAIAGYRVVFKELRQELVSSCFDQIERLFAGSLKKGRMTQEEVVRAMALVEGRTDFEGIENADLVIEAIPESIALKGDLFQQLDALCKPETIFATNTSALPITEIASFVRRRDRFIGMHWFNPPSVMKLIEVTPGLETSEDVVQTLLAVSRKLGKVPIRLKECPGFLVARLLGMYVNEGFWLLDEGHLPADIDQACTDSGIMPMGVFTLGDMAGWDVVYHANKTLYESFGTRYRIPPRFEVLVAEGRHGMKTGEGVFKYQKGESGQPVRAGDAQTALTPDQRAELGDRILAVLMNEGIRCLDEGIANEADIDRAMQLGAGMSQGPLHLADELGLDRLLNELDSRKEALGERYWPPYLLRRKVHAGHLGLKTARGFFEYAGGGEI